MAYIYLHLVLGVWVEWVQWAWSCWCWGSRASHNWLETNRSDVSYLLPIGVRERKKTGCDRDEDVLDV